MFTSSSSWVQARVGLQGIHGADRELVAHELLFRAAVGDQHAQLSGREEHDRATAQVISTVFGDFGVEDLAGGKLLFLNTTRSFFTGAFPLPFAPEGVVLELLEDVDVDHVVLRGIRALRERGYRIAVDDFDGELWRVPALRYADFVKIDLEATGARLPEVLDLVRTVNPAAAVVVERVESEQQFDRCRALGVELFQGYLLHRPDVVHRQALGTTHLSCVRLLAALHTPDTSLDDVVDLLNHDPALSVRVLKTVSSAAYAPRGGITSVRQAVVLLGRRELADWVTLLLLGGSGAAGVTQEDLVWIFTRAEACRLLSPTDPDSAFTVGLLSAAAQALGVDCAEMLRGCSLADHVRDALLHGGGELGSTLQIAAGHDTAPDVYVQAVGHARRAARKVVGEHDGGAPPARVTR